MACWLLCCGRKRDSAVGRGRGSTGCPNILGGEGKESLSLSYLPYVGSARELQPAVLLDSVEEGPLEGQDPPTSTVYLRAKKGINNEAVTLKGLGGGSPKNSQKSIPRERSPERADTTQK